MMRTIDELNKEVTLLRLQMFCGHRRETAQSLGIGVRTLLLWLTQWGLAELIPRGNTMRFVRCNRNLEVPQDGIFTGNVEIIHKGAVGVEVNGIISFPKEDVRNCLRDVARYAVDELSQLDPRAVISISEPFDPFPDSPTTNESSSATDTTDNDLRSIDLSSELYREYTWGDPEHKVDGSYTARITNPIRLYYRPGGSTHRVVHKEENGQEVVSCVPAIGYFGCVCTWKAREGQPAVVA